MGEQQVSRRSFLGKGAADGLAFLKKTAAEA